MAAKTVKAKWVGPYEAELPDGTPLIPGETLVELGGDEAEASDNWEIVKGRPTKSDELPAGGAAAEEADD